MSALSLTQVEGLLKSLDTALRSVYHVESLAVFGSVARGVANTESDLDILVEFSRPTGLIGLLRLKSFLELHLKTKVDLATVNALHPQMKDGF